MNWKCELVMDLAPLYYDGVASRVSKRLVKKHLRECPQCRTYYKKISPRRQSSHRSSELGCGGKLCHAGKKSPQKTACALGRLPFLSEHDNCCTGVLVCKGTKKDEKNLRQKMPKIRGFSSALFFAQKIFAKFV